VVTPIETRWDVAVLPGGELAAALFEHDVPFRLQLAVATDDPQILDVIEKAAERNGMTITRATDG
jgi:hypothetical protein